MSADNLSLPPITHGYAQLDKVRLHFAQCGSGDRLILFLHGFPQNWYCWRHQLAAMGTDFTAVAPDLRGYNLSDKPEPVGAYSIDVLVEDVMQLISFFGHRNAVIVGHDWGAGIAWVLAQLYPESVDRLVCMQVPPLSVWRRNLTVRQALASWYMLFFQIPFLPELWIRAGNFAALEKMFLSTTWMPGVFTAGDIERYRQGLRKNGALTAAVNYYRANFFRLFLQPPPARETGHSDRRILMPTLFIYGEQDFAILPSTVENAGSVVEAEYREVRFPDSNHWVQEEKPSEVNAALKEFLSV